jgi:hypothetical protein
MFGSKRPVGYWPTTRPVTILNLAWGAIDQYWQTTLGVVGWSPDGAPINASLEKINRLGGMDVSRVAWLLTCQQPASVWLCACPIVRKDIPLERNAPASALLTFAGGLRLNHGLPNQPPWGRLTTALQHFTTTMYSSQLIPWQLARWRGY